LADIYTTKQGDTWDLIAFKIWGDEYLCGKLMDENIDHVSTVIFSAGVVLKVPEVEKVSQTESLPPWKR